MSITEQRTPTKLELADAAAARFLADKQALEDAKKAVERSRKEVIASFKDVVTPETTGTMRHAGVLCTPREDVEADTDAVLRLKNPKAVEACTEVVARVARLRAALLSGLITKRQFAACVTTKPTFVVQPETVKVPKITTAA